jgi:hypothetical protein
MLVFEPNTELCPGNPVHRAIGGIVVIPSHVEAFGSFMDETARKAATKGLEPRDLLKAYLITRASIQRQAIGADKLRDSGLILPEGIGKVRPEGAMGEWLHSKYGQSYLDQAEKGIVDHEAVEHAQKVMKPFGKMTETEALPWAAENLSRVATMPAKKKQEQKSPVVLRMSPGAERLFRAEFMG